MGSPDAVDDAVRLCEHLRRSGFVIGFTAIWVDPSTGHIMLAVRREDARLHEVVGRARLTTPVRYVVDPQARHVVVPPDDPQRPS